MSESEGMREGDASGLGLGRDDGWVAMGDQSASSSTARGAVLGVGACGRACMAWTGVRGDGGGAKCGKRRRYATAEQDTQSDGQHRPAQAPNERDSRRRQRAR